MSADKELIERLRDQRHLVQGDGLKALLETCHAAAARLEALQPSPETSLQNMQTREAPRREEESLYPLLASAWFYGGWKAETHNERKMQAVMEQAGWWPIANESELLEKLSSSPTVEGGEEEEGSSRSHGGADG